MILNTAALTLFSLLAIESQAQEIPKEQFDALRGLIKPNPEESRWEEIPWIINNLWDARRKAAAEGKPIVLWSMDGLPLGLT